MMLKSKDKTDERTLMAIVSQETESVFAIEVAPFGCRNIFEIPDTIEMKNSLDLFV